MDVQPGEPGRRPVGYAAGASGIKADRPSVVFIHGAGGSRRAWEGQLAGLDGRFNVVALELPGHGETPGPAAESVARMAEFVAETVEAWGLPRPLAVGGHSMGGAVVLETAIARPDIADGLIVVGSGAAMPVNEDLFKGLEADFEGTVRLIVKWAVDKSAPEEVARITAETMISTGRETVISDFKACAAFDRRADVERISLPALIICGDRDKMTPPRSSEFLRDSIPGSKLVLVENGGHTVMGEQPEAVNRAAADFMGSLGQWRAGRSLPPG